MTDYLKPVARGRAWRFVCTSLGDGTLAELRALAAERKIDGCTLRDGVARLARRVRRAQLVRRFGSGKSIQTLVRWM